MSSVIGIDLGTTISCVSVYRNGRAELIPNTEGNRLTPSIVFFDPRNGDVSVGQIADDLSPRCPQNCLFDAKRFIGRQYDDEFISRYIKSNQRYFSLVRGSDDQAAFEVTISNRNVIKKPEEVSAEVLKYLKQTASTYLGETVTKAVISIPAYFSNAQRDATRKAGKLAGLDVLNLLTEPTAAAVHYVSDKNRTNSNILVFDFGGGTLDVSIINAKDNIFEVKAVYGDTLLGGRNFDENLFEDFYKRFLLESTHNCNFSSAKFKRRLSHACTDLKIKLSTREEFIYFIDRHDGNSDLELSMTRRKFEKLNKGIFRRIMDVVELCLEDSGLNKDDVNEVVLVGGSTRIPKIHELLGSYFDVAKLKTDLNPDEAVAAGSSVYAAFLQGDQNLEKYKVTEVTPMSLGCGVEGNLMSVFIPKNSPLPATASNIQITVLNDQTAVSFTIFEGERKNTRFNNKLGVFEIKGLPKKRAGDVEFSVNFNLDKDGLLTVSATETSTGKNNKLVVTMGQFRLSEKKVKSTLAEARHHKIEDEIFEKFIILRSELRRQCHHVLYDIKKIPSEKYQNFIKESCEKFLKDSQALDFTEIEKLESIFVVYNDSVSYILKENVMLELEY